MANTADFDTGIKAYELGDYATALRIFRQLADQGYAQAQYNLGLMYNDGRGVPQDYSEAVRWYRKAANQGDAGGQYGLGTMYNNGEGVPQDHSEAVKWYRKAADQGYAQAQCNLGIIYDEGIGVVHWEHVQAHMWYNLAAARGNEIARTRRDLLANGMTPEQIAKAHQLAGEWKPKGK